MSDRKGQCCAEMPVHNGVAYCIKEKGHDGLHLTGEITFGESAPTSADEITRLRARVKELEGAFRSIIDLADKGAGAYRARQIARRAITSQERDDG